MTSPVAACWLCGADLPAGSTAGRKFCSDACRGWVQAKRDAYRRRKGLDAPTSGLGAQSRPRGVWAGCVVCGAALAQGQERTCSKAHRQTWYRWRQNYSGR